MSPFRHFLLLVVRLFITVSECSVTTSKYIFSPAFCFLSTASYRCLVCTKDRVHQRHTLNRSYFFIKCFLSRFFFFVVNGQPSLRRVVCTGIGHTQSELTGGQYGTTIVSRFQPMRVLDRPMADITKHLGLVGMCPNEPSLCTVVLTLVF